MFLWQEPIGLKIFGTSPEQAASSAVLAMNQGLYNGFLAAGLFWAAYLIRRADLSRQVLLFFLGCVVVAGIFGAATAKFSILFTQALPAAIGFAVAAFAWKPQAS
ncbi:MAG: DUF1304 domain-containing protein [Leptospirales bacterium]|nr:DUF1304 domain-containing protein [Leptospirales bacterium]